MNDARRRGWVVTVLILLGICLLVYAAGEGDLLRSAAAFVVSAILLLRAFFMMRVKA